MRASDAAARVSTSAFEPYRGRSGPNLTGIGFWLRPQENFTCLVCGTTRRKNSKGQLICSKSQDPSCHRIHTRLLEKRRKARKLERVRLLLLSGTKKRPATRSASQGGV